MMTSLELEMFKKLINNFPVRSGNRIFFLRGTRKIAGRWYVVLRGLTESAHIIELASLCDIIARKGKWGRKVSTGNE